MTNQDDGRLLAVLRKSLAPLALPVATASLVASLSGSTADATWADVIARASQQPPAIKEDRDRLPKPLILTSASDKWISFGHGSHSSHSSHSSHASHSSHVSHYSGGGSSPTPPPVAPPPKPPSTNPPVPKAPATEKEPAKRSGTRSIYQIASKQETLKSLVAAIRAADLDETLDFQGPFVLLAPTDQAFSRMTTESLDDLLRPVNKTKLRSILRYHIVPGKFTIDDIAGKKFLTTANGQRLRISNPKGSMSVNDIKIHQDEIGCDNGLILLVDDVLIPNETDILKVLDSRGFKIFLECVRDAGLDDVLSLDVPFTVFAPTDLAFKKLPPGMLERLRKPENRSELRALLQRHIVQSRVFVPEGAAAETVQNLNHTRLRLSIRSGVLFVDDAAVTNPDIEASNGVLQGIDTLLLKDGGGE